MNSMVLSQWSLSDTCICALSSVLVIELDCCTNAPSIGKTGKTLNYGTVARLLILFHPAWQLLMMMETGKRMALSQWSLADTYMSALSSVLGYELDCCMNATLIGKTGNTLN